MKDAEINSLPDAISKSGSNIYSFSRGGVYNKYLDDLDASIPILDYSLMKCKHWNENVAFTGDDLIEASENVINKRLMNLLISESKKYYSSIKKISGRHHRLDYLIHKCIIPTTPLNTLFLKNNNGYSVDGNILIHPPSATDEDVSDLKERTIENSKSSKTVVHLVVLVHGFLGHHSDLLLLRNILATEFPKHTQVCLLELT